MALATICSDRMCKAGAWQDTAARQIAAAIRVQDARESLGALGSERLGGDKGGLSLEVRDAGCVMLCSKKTKWLAGAGN
jgi:hypothetical protein